MAKQNNEQEFETILDEVKHIIYERSSIKQIEYGEFNDSMRIAADILGNIIHTRVSTKEYYLAMIALKLSRLGSSFKRDTYLDLIAYITALYEYEDLTNKTNNTNE